VGAAEPDRAAAAVVVVVDKGQVVAVAVEAARVRVVAVDRAAAWAEGAAVLQGREASASAPNAERPCPINKACPVLR